MLMISATQGFWIAHFTIHMFELLSNGGQKILAMQPTLAFLGVLENYLNLLAGLAAD